MKEILPENTKKKCRLILSNGFDLNPDCHEISISKLRVQSTGILIDNPTKAWKKIDHYHLLEGVFKNGKLHCPGLKVRPKYQNRQQSSKGITKNNRMVLRRKERSKTRMLDSIVTLPVFLRNMTPTSTTFKNHVKCINIMYKRCFDFGKPSRLSSLIEATNLSSFKKSQRNLESSLSTYKINGTIELHLSPKREFKYHTRSDDKSSHTNRDVQLESEILLFEHEMKCQSILMCPSCRENVMIHNDSESLKKKQLNLNSKTRRTCSRCSTLERSDHYEYYNLHPVWYEHDENGNMVLKDGNPIVHYEVPQELSCLTTPEKMLIR